MGKVRRFFKLLQDDGMIALENVKKTTRLKVCNYDTYNKPQQANDTQTARQRHANGTQATSNNKDNKDKKGEKLDPIPQTYGSSPEQSTSPSIDDVRLVFHQNGGTQEMADTFFNKHSATGWRLNNTPIANYRYLVPTFIKNYIKVEEKSGGYTAPAPVNGSLQPNDFV
jgi:hypothetical protein